MKASSTLVFSSVLLGILNVESFQIPAPTRAPCVKFADAITRTHEVKVPILRGKAGDDDGDGGAKSETKKGKRASVMAFLRRKGAVGRNQDFSTAMGVDEGPVGKNKSVVKKLQKSKESYKWCTDTGIIDDMSEAFPLTSSGSQWRGFTDQVMGGISIGKLIRESIKGRTCNVMKGNVSLYNNGGFIQMATDLSKDPASSLTVDATKFKGVELDVFYQGAEDSENFNVHLRNNSCERQNSSYRGTFEAKQGVWCTVRLPFTDFTGHGPGCVDVPFDVTTLRRMGIVAIGKKMEVYLGIGRVAFY